MCGCMMQEPEEQEKVKTTFKFVDVVFGTHNIFKLAELLYECLSGRKRVFDVLGENRSDYRRSAK